MNRIVVTGNLTRDPELTTTASGVDICRFTVAVQRRFKNTDGEREADFLPVVVWREQAKSCAKYLRKGSKAGVIGALQTRSWEAEDGTTRRATEIVADEVEFLTPKSEADPQPKKKTVSDLDPVDDDDLPF